MYETAPAECPSVVDVCKILNYPSSDDKTFQIVSEKFNEVSKLTHRRVQNIEFLILALGTLVWGYGDLINNFL